MIRIKPEFELNFPCPECGSIKTVVSKISVPGIHWLADTKCQDCGFGFFQSLPVGHTIDYKVAIGKNNRKLYGHGGKWYWQSEPFLKFCTTIRSKEVSIRKLVFKEHKRVIILNTLDFWYGHILLKLYNSQWHLDKCPDYGLIIIIPKAFEWLIPKGTAEAWIVDLGLSQLFFGHEAIDKFVTAECERFTEVLVSKAYSHPDFTTIDISRLTGVQPFDLEEFYHRKPLFTFALREDRWWVKNRVSNIIYDICVKLKRPRLICKLLTRSQNKLVMSTIRNIRKQLPDAEFCIVGLGNTGNFGKNIIDKRFEKLNPEIEREWCSIYAKSHVVIGVHGSNMLLPTALSAGCVEILPNDRTGNIGQDISVRYSDRKQMFFYRFVDQCASPKSVARKASAIVKDYDNYYRNMILNLYR